MPKSQNAKSQTPKKSLRHKKLYVTLALVLGIPLLLVGILDITYQLRVNKLKSANQQIYSKVLEPLGGIKNFSGVNGPHVWNICVDNGPCPEANDSWFVLINTGDEKSIEQKVMGELKAEGYESETINSKLGGTKGIVSLDFGLDSLGSYEPPYAAPSGKEWKRFWTSAFETPRY